MRYLLFFFFLFLHSQFVFAQNPPASCDLVSRSGCIASSLFSDFASACTSEGEGFAATSIVALCGNDEVPVQCSLSSSCQCPDGFVYNVKTVAGVTSGGCIPDEGGETPPDDSCDESEKVYDSVTGTLVCPGSGDGNSSAAASSNSCVVPGDFNGDCVPDDDQASSANNSTPTSSPDSGSAASTGGDDGGGGGDNGGGGGGDDGGGNNNGGGSASSSASFGSNSSWVSHSGYGNWIPVTEGSTCPNKYKDQSGQWWCAGGNSSPLGDEPVEIEWTGDCNPTSKTYFSCITSQKLDGSNNTSSSGWTPISGYGNWIPVTEESNCPNKFKDASGNWWCSGGATGGGGSGTASSGGASGSAHSAAGECDSTSKDYLQCISTGKTSSRSSDSASSVSSGSASSSNSGAFSSLGERGEFDGEASEKKMDELKEELDQKIADIKADIQGEFGGTISGTGTIQDFCKNIRSSEVCFGLKKWEPFLDPISAAIFLVACVMAFSIVLRG